MTQMLKHNWIRNYSLSYARNLIVSNSSSSERLTIGVTGKIIHGFSYIGTDRVNYNVTTGSSHEITGNTDLRGYSAFSDAFGVQYDFDTVKQQSSWGAFHHLQEMVSVLILESRLLRVTGDFLPR